MKPLSHPKILIIIMLLTLGGLFYSLNLSPRNESGKAQTGSRETNCLPLKDEEQLNCWMDKIKGELKNGVDGALELLAQIYQREPSVAQNCHNFVHEIGKGAYEEFSRDRQEFAVSSKSFYCGYGFYHGFMETLVARGGDVVEAKNFCHYVGEKLADTSPDAKGACFHGIGHGLSDPHDNQPRLNAQELIDPVLKICERISSSSEELYRCSTGLFNGVEILASEGKYGLSINPRDPFSICHTERPQYKKGCYENMVPALIPFTKGEFPEGVKFIEKIPEDEYALPALQALAVELTRIDLPHEDKYQGAIILCRRTPNRFQDICLRSYAEGLMKYGPPGQEYQEAVIFCRHPQLTAEERESCFRKILGILYIFYNEKRTKEICGNLEKIYQKYCFWRRP